MPRTVPIRVSLTRDLVLIILILSGSILGMMGWTTGRAVRSLSASLTESTIELAEQRLDRFFDPVERQIRVIAALGARGLLPLEDAAALDRLLTPIIKVHPQVSSLMIGDTRGREYMLLRVAGSWRSRMMRADEWGDEARWREWSDAADAQVTERLETLEYDPRDRPWFVGALQDARSSDQAPATWWTEPYTFFTTREPGITCSRRFTTPDGVTHVVGLDVLLRDITEFTTELEVSESGRATVLSADGRLVGLPRDPLFASKETRESALLQRIDDVGWALAIEARDALGPFEGGQSRTMRFEHAGSPWWVSIQPFQLGPGRTMWISVLVPESDILRGLAQLRLWVIALATVILAGAAWRGVMLARRFSEPIEQLVEQSDRFGRGDLDDTSVVESPVHEVQKLAEAQEQMRLALRSLLKVESDLRLARRIQQATLPERIPQVPGFAISGWNEPAEETGGDTFDIFGFSRGADGAVLEQPERASEALLMLADATGHGIGPALNATQIRAMIRMAMRLDVGFDQLIDHLNEQIYADMATGRFITAWLGLVSAQSGTVSSFSAGQGPILWYRHGSGTIEVLGADVPPLGVLPRIDVSATRAIRLDPGDLLVVVSDGIVEAENQHSEKLGATRLEQIIREHHDCDPGEIIEQIRKAVTRHEGGRAAADDKTVITIRRNA